MTQNTDTFVRTRIGTWNGKAIEELDDPQRRRLLQRLVARATLATRERQLEIIELLFERVYLGQFAEDPPSLEEIGRKHGLTTGRRTDA